MNNFKFEDGLKELETIVNKLENGELTLDESLSQFEKGIEIYKKLNATLNKAEGKIKLIINENEQYIEEDFVKET